MAEDAETVSELLAAWAATKPDAPLFSWLEDKNQTVKATLSLTYGDVEKAAARTAHKLRHKEGVKEGDRCLLVYEPGLAYIVAFLGCRGLEEYQCRSSPRNPEKEDERIECLLPDCRELRRDVRAHLVTL